MYILRYTSPVYVYIYMCYINIPLVYIYIYIYMYTYLIHIHGLIDIASCLLYHIEPETMHY